MPDKNPTAKKSPEEGSFIGVLLADKESDAQIGFILFNPQGTLVYQMIKEGLHIYALKRLDYILNEWEKEPLYKKYAKELGKKKILPDEILELEAKSCAEFINSQEKPLKISSSVIKARMVHGTWK